MNKRTFYTEYPSKRLKFVASINDEALSEITDPDFEINYIDIGNVNSAGEINEVVSYKFRNAPSRARRKVQKGDVIISTVRTYLRAIASIDSDDVSNVIVSTGFAVIRPKKNIFHPEFCKYALTESDFIDEVQRRSVGVSYPAINASDLGDICVPVPTYKAQVRISNYLNNEIGEIEKLVKTKERLIDILTEKRQALITHVLTKGLNANVKLKNSGVEWLGELPEHWNIVRIKFLGKVNYGLSQPPQYRDQGTALIRATNVQRGDIITDGLVYINENDIPTSKKIKLSEGDIIVVRSGAYTGDSALVTSEWEGAIAGFDMILRPDKSIASPNFLSITLLSDYVLNCQLIPASARAAQPHLNAEELGDTIIGLPPLKEQDAIVQYLQIELNKILNIKNATIRSIDLLKERRTALISATVTGQIKIPEV